MVLALLVVGCGAEDGDADSLERVQWLQAVEPGIDMRHQADDPIIGPPLAAADLDADGRVDVLVGGGLGPMRAYRNVGGLRFEEATASWGIEGVQATAIAVVEHEPGAGPSILAASSEGLRLFHRGADAFEEGTAEAGLDAIDVMAPVHLLPADIDRDGLLDVYVSSYGGPNRLLRARGDGTFEDRATAWGLDDASHTWSASWYDQNGDGAPDLYLANDAFEFDVEGLPEYAEERRGMGDLLYRNLGWDDAGEPAFAEVAAEVRLDVPRGSMGGLVSDLDADGALDLFISDMGRNHALSSAEDGTYTYRTAELGLDGFVRGDLDGCPNDPTASDRCTLVSWGAFHEDFSGDGVADLLVTNGGLEPDERGPQPVSAYRWREGAFEEVELDVPTAFARSALAADLDGDGDADLVVGPWNGIPTVLENVSDCTRLAVRVDGLARGAGGEVTVRVAGQRIRRTVAAGGRAQAHGPADVRLCVPDAASAVTVELRQPGGVRRTLETDASVGTVHIDAPPAVEVSGRAFPADGATEIEVFVHPSGEPSEVSVEAAGIAETAVAERVDATRWRAVLTSPAEAGVATLTAVVDGEPLGLRPRLVFE